MKNIIVTFFLFVSNLLFSQYITGLNVTQNGTNQIKANLKVYLPNLGEFSTHITSIDQNIITLSACYLMTDFGAISNLENDFYIDIPNNGNYTLKVNLFTSSDPTTCNYLNLEDTVMLNFIAPIEGTVSLNTIDLENNNEKLLLFPNPTKGILNIKTSQKTEQINIFDATGKQVRSIQNTENKIDVSNLANGVYYIEILNSKGKFREKFVVAK